jgi:hypothetical protein
LKIHFALVVILHALSVQDQRSSDVQEVLALEVKVNLVLVFQDLLS